MLTKNDHMCKKCNKCNRSKELGVLTFWQQQQNVGTYIVLYLRGKNLSESKPFGQKNTYKVVSSFELRVHRFQITLIFRETGVTSTK